MAVNVKAWYGNQGFCLVWIGLIVLGVAGAAIVFARHYR